MRRPYAALVCVLAVIPFVAAQTLLRPVPSETHRLATAETIVLPVKCDGGGNIYFRFPSAGFSSFNLVKISPDGSQKASYHYSDVPEFKDAYLGDFAIGDDEKVYEIVRATAKSIFVVRFSADGQLDGKTEIATDEPLNPSQLIVLTDGSFFVSGTLSGDKAGRDSGTPFNAIYNSSGKLVRKVTLKEDASPKEPSKKADGPVEVNLGVRFGRALLGDEGNLYVMRAVSPASVYVISPTGDLLRTLKVQPPIDKGVPVEMKINAGRLALEFSVPDAPDVSDTRIRVVDTLTGKTITDYRIVPELGEVVACYVTDNFTFLGAVDGGWPAIMQAATH